jgi:hypothetical protein
MFHALSRVASTGRTNAAVSGVASQTSPTGLCKSITDVGRGGECGDFRAPPDGKKIP